MNVLVLVLVLVITLATSDQVFGLGKGGCCVCRNQHDRIVNINWYFGKRFKENCDLSDFGQIECEIENIKEKKCNSDKIEAEDQFDLNF